MIVILPFEISSLWKFAGVDDNRQSITHVLIKFNCDLTMIGAATNGHYLATQESRYITPEQPTGSLSILIPATALKSIKQKDSCVLDTDNRSLTVGNVKTMFESPEAETYPRYEQIIPQTLGDGDKDRAHNLGLNAEYLGLFGAHCKRVFGNSNLNLQVPLDNRDPILLKSDSSGFTGVIMPVRL